MELIKIEKRNGVDTVSARELHSFLRVKSDFSHWIKRRIDEYKFIQGEDFTVVKNNDEDINGLQGFTPIEYYITIDMAKELSMVERNARGREARKFFIECEKQLINLKDHKTLSEKLEPYKDHTYQKSCTKLVQRKIYFNPANPMSSEDIIVHHKNICKSITGKTPSQYRKSFVDQGYRVKSKTAREIQRRFEPGKACTSAYYDEAVVKGKTIDQLNEVKLNELLPPVFDAMLKIGIIDESHVHEKTYLEKQA